MWYFDSMVVFEKRSTIMVISSAGSETFLNSDDTVLKTLYKYGDQF